MQDMKVKDIKMQDMKMQEIKMQDMNMQISLSENARRSTVRARENKPTTYASESQSYCHVMSYMYHTASARYIIYGHQTVT